MLIIDGAGVHSHRVVSRRTFRKHLIGPPIRTGAAKTEQDWKAQEDAEENRPTPPDVISAWVGTRYFYLGHTKNTWRNGVQDRPVKVDRYYPHEGLIVDFPKSNEETQRRAQLFEQLGIKYMYVDFNEEMTERQFKERLTIIRRDHAKAKQLADGPGAVSAAVGS